VFFGTLFGIGLARAQDPQAAWKKIAPHFNPPVEFAHDLGAYRSPLQFADGTWASTPAQWQKRRTEIRAEWDAMLGAWPEIVKKPTIEYLKSEKRENFTQHHVRIQIAPDRFTDDAFLLVPEGKGPFPAVIVVYYDAKTGIGDPKKGPFRDYAYQLARRGFVALSIGSDPMKWYPSNEDARPQPLSFHAYEAVMGWHILASLGYVDPARIGVVGHSYGGKWALFASCLFEGFACAAWSDPGIVFDERRSGINYWEPWYLGFEKGVMRKRGIPSADNPRTGPYKKMIDEGRDLHELHALMAPRPFLVSGGAEDTVERWRALNHTRMVNRVLGVTNRVAMTNRPMHSPNEEANDVLYAFFEHFLVHQKALPAPTPKEAAELAQAAANVKHILGHRGSLADRPENTRVGYLHAIASGATAIECDVRTTADGVLVSAHDDDVRRTTNGAGKISAMSFAEVRKLDAGAWFHPVYKGERVPTLREILEMAKGKCGIVLDLKETGEEYAQRVAAEVRKHGEPARVLVGVRSPAQARQFRKLLPEAKQIGLIPSPKAIEEFGAEKVEFIRLWSHWLSDESLVPRVRKTGAALHLNGTTCEPDEVRSLLRHRPESICSDHPGRLVSVLAKLRQAALPGNKTTHVYKTVDGVQVQADVYPAAGPGKRPVLVWLHGGALIGGSRSAVPQRLLKQCREENYHLVSFDYRLAPEAKLPAILEDVKDAFRWLRAKGPDLFGADTERIVVSGGSAGGYLTMMIGAIVEPRPTALLAYWGYGDIDTDWLTKPSEFYRRQPLVPKDEALAGVFQGVVAGADTDNAKARSRFYLYTRQNGLWPQYVAGVDPEKDRKKLEPYCPARLVTKEYPPLLMIHGTNDTDVPHQKSEVMAEALRRIGVKHELILVEGAGHGLGGGDPRAEERAHERAADFIRTHLGQ
jgi:acetyl esterase/lipase